MRRPDRLLSSAPAQWLAATAAVLALASAFFVAIGREPLSLLWLIVQSAVGDGYALTETLVRTTPILLCALATAVPARSISI